MLEGISFLAGGHQGSGSIGVWRFVYFEEIVAVRLRPSRASCASVVGSYTNMVIMCVLEFL